MTKKIGHKKLGENHLRQKVLKQLLIRVRNGAMITPVIFEIEQLYNGDYDYSNFQETDKEDMV